MSPGVELRHLKSFVAVAEELHFGRAAQRLHVVQPAVSRQIRLLEQELGVTLLARTRRRVELTEAGARFLDGARRALAEVEQSVRVAQRAGRGEVGRVAVGFVGSAVVLPPVLRAFRRRFPAVELELHQLTTARQVEALRDGRLHVGLLRPPITARDLSLEPVHHDRLVVVLPERHPLARRSRITVAALAGEPFILWPRREGPGFHDQVVALCRRAGFSPRVAQEAVEMQTIVSLVAGGLGVSVVPSSIALWRRGRVVYRPLAGAALWVEMALAWRSGDVSPAARAFVETVREIRDRLGWRRGGGGR